MRFQDQYSILKKSIDLLTVKTNTIQSAAGTRIKINDVTKLNAAITSLEDFSYLKKEVEDNTDNEYKNRLIYSITELAKLINDGVQVHPSLMAPEESKNLFPDYKNLDYIESKTKLIEEKK